MQARPVILAITFPVVLWPQTIGFNLGDYDGNVTERNIFVNRVVDH